MRKSRTLQEISSEWVYGTFGEDCALDITERAKRVVEEAIELAQASGVRPDDVYRLVGWVYSRPPGEVNQELAGVGVTLLAAATANGYHLETEVAKELDRVLSLPKEKLLAKRKLKQEAGITEYGGLSGSS